MDKTKYGAHSTHCCAIHGCKYGDDDCPIVSGEINQKYECQDCGEEFGSQFVIIINSSNLPDIFIGNYGKLEKYFGDGKWFIRFKETVNGVGGFSLVVHYKDFKLI